MDISVCNVVLSVILDSELLFTHISSQLEAAFAALLSYGVVVVGVVVVVMPQYAARYYIYIIYVYVYIYNICNSIAFG